MSLPALPASIPSHFGVFATKVILAVKIRAFERRVLGSLRGSKRSNTIQQGGESGAANGGGGSGKDENSSAVVAVPGTQSESETESNSSTNHPWAKFTVWGAGRDGKAFVNELMPVSCALI